MQCAAIQLEQVEFAWPGEEPVLCIDELRILRRQRVLLMGPSGSGKSTLLGLIGGVLEPRCGQVCVLGTRLGALGRGATDQFRADHIGFIFQSFNLLPYLSVEANVRLPLRFSRARRARLAGASGQQEAVRLLGALGLAAPDLLARKAHRLSIGQLQRAAAARALIGSPEILIADEPTSSLDAHSRGGFIELLMSECARLGTTVLFVSHERSLAPLFDRIIELPDINRARPVPA